MEITIAQINEESICDVVSLLKERSNTIESYTRWKYARTEEDRFRGVVAKIGANPVGCLGCMPNVLKMSDGATLQCGWFADWYVSPQARGQGIGKLLLGALSKHEKIIFGHPGPEHAQKACRRAGYIEITFQSRRRLVVRPFSYLWKRGMLLSQLKRNTFRTLGLFSPEKTEASKAPQSDLIFDASAVDYNTFDDGLRTEFIQSASYKRFVLDQPVADGFSRRNHTWSEGRLKIIYFDDRLQKGEVRRLILHVDGMDCYKVDLWRKFIQEAERQKCDYIEFFTTDQRLDKIYSILGAWSIQEAPVMVWGLSKSTQNFRIQPWDRENWTYLAQ